MKKRVRILMLFILFFSAVTPAYATVTSTIETRVLLQTYQNPKTPPILN